MNVEKWQLYASVPSSGMFIIISAVVTSIHGPEYMYYLGCFILLFGIVVLAVEYLEDE